jgi:hypothetical protein
MADVIFIAVIVAFFAVAAAYVKGCERILGPDTETGGGIGAHLDEATALESVLGRGR